VCHMNKGTVRQNNGHRNHEMCIEFENVEMKHIQCVCVFVDYNHIYQFFVLTHK
jgi:hypothetical protein